jgi:hypothetical protein
MSDDVAKFVAARLDDDEAFARTMTEVGNRQAAAATPGDIADVYGLAVGVLSDPQVMPLIERYMDGPILPPNNLDRILREIEAKRAILATHEAVLADCHSVGQPARRPRKYGEYDGLHKAVAELAAVYSDHPDYRPGWKP